MWGTPVGISAISNLLTPYLSWFNGNFMKFSFELEIHSQIVNYY